MWLAFTELAHTIHIGNGFVKPITADEQTKMLNIKASNPVSNLP